MATTHSLWEPFLSTLSKDGKMDLTFVDVRQEIDTDDLIVGKYPLLGDTFGDRLKIWDDPLFYTHLNRSFGVAINKILSLRYS